MMLMLMLMLVSSLAFASEGHNHEAAIEPAPKGGYLRDAKPYKGELVINGDTARIYVYDEKTDPLTMELKLSSLSATALEGKYKLPLDKKDKQVTFKKEGEAFVAKIPGISKVHRWDLHVALKEQGREVTLDFGIDNIH